MRNEELKKDETHTTSMNSHIGKGEIIIYQSNDKSTQLEVRIEEETVWLSQSQMVELFNSTKQNISLHINNIYKEGELQSSSTVKDYLTVQMEGGRRFAFSKIELNAMEMIETLKH